MGSGTLSHLHRSTPQGCNQRGAFRGQCVNQVRACPQSWVTQVSANLPTGAPPCCTIASAWRHSSAPHSPEGQAKQAQQYRQYLSAFKGGPWWQQVLPCFTQHRHPAGVVALADLCCMTPGSRVMHRHKLLSPEYNRVVDEATRRMSIPGWQQCPKIHLAASIFVQLISVVDRGTGNRTPPRTWARLNHQVCFRGCVKL